MSPTEWIRDLRLALRLLAKNPGATALAVLSIALGIGLTTGLFAVGDAALLRPLPVEKPQELWSATSRGDDGNFMMYGWPDYLDMAKALEGRAQASGASRSRRRRAPVTETPGEQCGAESIADRSHPGHRGEVFRADQLAGHDGGLATQGIDPR